MLIIEYSFEKLVNRLKTRLTKYCVIVKRKFIQLNCTKSTTLTDIITQVDDYCEISIADRNSSVTPVLLLWTHAAAEIRIVI